MRQQLQTIGPGKPHVRQRQQRSSAASQLESALDRQSGATIARLAVHAGGRRTAQHDRAPFNQNPLLAYQGDGINNQGGLLWPFIKNKNVYWCPTDLATNTPGYRARINKMSTYIMSGAVCGFGASMSGYKLTQFRQDAYISWEPE